MKLIDEKGRLFGKFNIIDIFIVLFIIAALIGVNYKLGLLKKVTDTQSQKHLVKLWVKGISSYTVNAISVGDTVKELRSNNDIGKIIKKEVAPHKDVGTDINGKWVLSEVPEKNDVFLTIETLSPKVNENIKLGSKDAKVGATLTIIGPKFQVECYVIGVE